MYIVANSLSFRKAVLVSIWLTNILLTAAIESKSLKVMWETTGEKLLHGEFRISVKTPEPQGEP